MAGWIHTQSVKNDDDAAEILRPKTTQDAKSHTKNKNIPHPHTTEEEIRIDSTLACSFEAQ